METSEAAMARMKRNITWPSAWTQWAPATIKARPAALSMISMDMSVNTRLRRTSRPIVPRANNIPASSSPCCIGIVGIRILQSFRLAIAQVVGAHQSAQQQHGSQFHADQVRTEEGGAHVPGFQVLNGVHLDGRARQQVHDFGDEHGGQNFRADPHTS